MASSPAFLKFSEQLSEGVEPRIVLFGAGHGSTYQGSDSSGHAMAPDAIRQASLEDAELVTHWDFDLGGPLFNGGPISCIDIGDLPLQTSDGEANRTLIEQTTRDILSNHAVPILLGGDDSAETSPRVRQRAANCWYPVCQSEPALSLLGRKHCELGRCVIVCRSWSFLAVLHDCCP